MKPEIQLEEVVKEYHEKKSELNRVTGDKTDPPFKFLSTEKKASVTALVKHFVENPTETPETLHDKWYREMLDAGWVHGEEFNEEKKTDPNMIGYPDLSEAVRKKDELLTEVIKEYEDYSIVTGK